jgi:hypothetical protein
MELCVAGRFRSKEIVTTDVHDEEGVARDEPAAIGARRKSVAADLNGRFGYEICLVLLLDGAGVAGGIYKSDEQQSIL